MRMDTRTVIPELPAPEITRPRMTCDMDWPSPLTEIISILHTLETDGHLHYRTVDKEVDQPAVLGST